MKTINVNVHGAGGPSLGLQLATLLVAAAAVFAGLVSVLLSARLAKNSEASSWLRNQQHRCYANFREEAVQLLSSLGAIREWWKENEAADDGDRSLILNRFSVQTHFDKLRQAQNETLIFGDNAVRRAQDEIERIASWGQIMFLFPPQADSPKAINSMWDNNTKLDKAIVHYVSVVRTSFGVPS